ncbi:MAG: hypothetical protein LJE67_03730 [Salaquimonas sp.]|nr:hypothetical protein [Salaquimonas sp.]
MKSIINLTAGIFGLVCTSVPASAGTIDLFDLAGNFNQPSFSGTYQYAQTLTADDVFWSELSFRVINDIGGTFSLEIYGVRDAGLPGTGWAPDVDNNLFSTVLTHLGGGLQTFTVAPNLSVSSGDGYVFVLNSCLDNNASNEGTLPSSLVRATQFKWGDRSICRRRIHFCP